MVKFSKIMFFMLLCCLLPSVSNAKIEKVEKYQWTGYSGGGCSTEKKACQIQEGFQDNGCPKYITKKADSPMTHTIQYCKGGKAGSSKLVCDGRGPEQVTLLNSCDCPDGMVDITKQYEASHLFDTLYPTAAADGFFRSILYSELSGATYVSKSKYCANIGKLTCKYGNKTLATIKKELNISSSTSVEITDEDGDGEKDNNSYNSYTFYNDSPKFKISTIGFTFNDNVCLQDSSQIEAICKGTAECDKIKTLDLDDSLISTSASLGCGDLGSKETFAMTLWNGNRQNIYYCGGCDDSDDDENKYVITAGNSCNSGHTSQVYADYAGYIGSQWKIHACKKCSNQCSEHPTVSSGLYVYANQPTDQDDYTINQGYKNGIDDGIDEYCPITCPDDTDVAFATTQKTANSSTTGVTSAEFDPCGAYSNDAERQGADNTVNANLLYNIDKFLNLNGATLVCANAVSCDFNRNYTATCSGGQLSSNNWCSFWATQAIDRTQYSQECGYACTGAGQQGNGAANTYGLYTSCKCDTDYKYQCKGYMQVASGMACTADPDTKELYKGCNCPAEYKYTCDGLGETGVGPACTKQPSGKEYYTYCDAPAVEEPEVGDAEITNYCSMGGDNIREAVMCHITALQNAAKSSNASITGYDGDNKEFIPVNKTIQLVPLVIKSQEHYNGVYKMLNNFTTDGQPALMYSSDGKNWISDESGEYKESLQYAINPYVYSYKFIEQGIHWLTSIEGDSSRLEDFVNRMQMYNEDNRNYGSDIKEFVETYSYIINLKDEKAGEITTYLDPRLGGQLPDEFPAIEEGGAAYYYVPVTNLDNSMDKFRETLSKLELKTEQLDPDTEETMFWYYLVNGYLQVDAQYYPQ